jgi:hypothetical protein
MSKKQASETGAPAAEPKKPDISNLLANNPARSIRDVTEKWYGINPNQIDPNLDSRQLEQVEMDFLRGRTITVLGFQKKMGEQKGKESPFLVIMLVPEGYTSPVIAITGAAVVYKKLLQAESENALPVKGMIFKPEGKDYFDFA